MKISTDEINKRIQMRSRALQRKIDFIEKKFEKPLTGFKKSIADSAYPRTEQDAKTVDEEAATLSRDIFSDYFPETLDMMLQQLLNDPESYIKKVEAYETHCPLPEIEFSTEKKEFLSSAKDPMRKMEEARVEKALLFFLEKVNSNHSDTITLLDLGSGSGRITKLLGDILKNIYGDMSNHYTVRGIDVLHDNVFGAIQACKNETSRVTFDVGDMNKLNIASHSVSFVSSVATSYLNSTHRRALEFAEIARVLDKKGGIACIVNPNEDFTCREYGYTMLRCAFDRYFNPFNIATTRRLGSRVLYTERLSKARPDMMFPIHSAVGKAIENVLKATLLDDYRWPRTGGPGLFGSHIFAMNEETNKALRKYTEYRDEQLKLDRKQHQ